MVQLSRTIYVSGHELLHQPGRDVGVTRRNLERLESLRDRGAPTDADVRPAKTTLLGISETSVDKP